MNLPDVLAIIVTWNKKDDLLALLASLRALDYPRERLHFLVVDNASEDGTVDTLARRHPEVEVIRNDENLGGTGGFNTGLAWGFDQPPGRFDYFWLLDNDVLVHRSALAALVNLMTNNADVGIAGSTIMQLDSPWRINEMGALVDRRCGKLLWQHHGRAVPAWRNRDMAELLREDIGLNGHMDSLPPLMDVDYVAAASLLVRAVVARDAGLWDNFFIHFDDVDWGLRIMGQGHRVVVSSASVVWHPSAVSKVRTWIVYYDNRNLLYLLQSHGLPGAVRCATRKILLKAIYYTALGKRDLGRLVLAALDDFADGVKGKKSIELDIEYRPLAEIDRVLQDKEIKRILIPSAIDLRPSDTLTRALRARRDLEIHYLHCDDSDANRTPLPDARLLILNGSGLIKWGQLLRFRAKYDLVIQSDGRPLPALSWLGREVLFVGLESFARVPRPKLSSLAAMVAVLTMRVRLLF